MLNRRADDPSFVGPLAIWLAIQLFALLLGAAHVRLWAGASRATESTAMHELLTAQFITSSLLFPFLCRSWQSTTALAIASVSMIGLAGLLAGLETMTCLVIAIDVCLWLFGLCFWRRMLVSSATQLIAVSLVASLTVMPVLLTYFAAEMRNVPMRLPFLPPFSALSTGRDHFLPGFASTLTWFLASAVLTKLFATTYPQKLSRRDDHISPEISGVS